MEARSVSSGVRSSVDRGVVGSCLEQVRSGERLGEQLTNVARGSQRDTLDSNSEKQYYGAENHRVGPLGNYQLLGRTVFFSVLRDLVVRLLFQIPEVFTSPGPYTEGRSVTDGILQAQT